MTSHKATFYAHVEAVYGPYYKDKVDYIKVTKVTQNKPSQLGKNTVAVKLVVEIPDEGFMPFSPTAVITVPLSQVQQQIHVITEEA